MLRTTRLRDRLIIWIAGSALVALVLISVLTSIVVRRAMINEVNQRVQNLVQAQVNEMDGSLQAVARIAVVLANSVAVDEENDEELLRARIREVVEKNPEIYGSTVAFEPYYFHPDQKYFSPYYYRSGDRIEYVQLGSDSYVYWERDWYVGARDSEGLSWAAPYFDEDAGDVWMTTASYPVARAGKFVGVATIDVALDELAQSIRELRVGERGYALVIDQDGNVIATSGIEELEGMSILDWQAKANNPELNKLLDRMLTGDEGILPLKRDPFKRGPLATAEWWAVYTSVPSTRWRVVVVVLGMDMLAPVQRIAPLIGGIALLAMAVLIGVVAFASNTITRPLETLRDEALLIAQGDLTRRVPVRTQDEIGAVGQAFNSMAEELASLVSGLEQRVEERTRELTRRAEQLQTVAEVSKAAGSVLDVDELLNTTVNLVRERFDLYYVGIFLVDERRQYAWLQAGTGEAGRKMLEQQHKLAIGGTSMIGWCVQRGQARIALDVGTDAVHFSNPLLPLTRSEMALPLRVRGEIIGAMTVQSTRERAFDDEDIVILQTMADQVAVAISNARLYAQTEAQLKDMARIHRRYLREEWATLIPTLPVTGFDLVGQDLRPLEDAALPEVAQAADISQPTVLETAEQPALVSPIVLRGQAIGALGLQDTTGTRQWTETEIALVDAVARQLALTIENLQLFEETQQRAARERQLREMAARIREPNELRDILQTALREVTAALEAPRVFVQLGTSEDVKSKT